MQPNKILSSCPNISGVTPKRTCPSKCCLANLSNFSFVTFLIVLIVSAPSDLIITFEAALNAKRSLLYSFIRNFSFLNYVSAIKVVISVNKIFKIFYLYLFVLLFYVFLN